MDKSRVYTRYKMLLAQILNMRCNFSNNNDLSLDTVCLTANVKNHPGSFFVSFLTNGFFNTRYLVRLDTNKIQRAAEALRAQNKKQKDKTFVFFG